MDFGASAFWAVDLCWAFVFCCFEYVVYVSE